MSFSSNSHDGGLYQQQQQVCQDLFISQFLQQDLPLDDLLFYVVTIMKSQFGKIHETVLVKRKGQDLAENFKEIPNLDNMGSFKHDQSINWFHTVALNLICQSDYLVKITILPTTEKKDTHKDLKANFIWEGKAFASPNKSYFGNEQTDFPNNSQSSNESHNWFSFFAHPANTCKTDPSIDCAEIRFDGKFRFYS